MNTSELFGKGGSYVLDPVEDQIKLVERIKMRADGDEGAGAPAEAQGSMPAFQPVGVEPVEVAQSKTGKHTKTNDPNTDGEKA
jgi:hypothetical protein